MKYRPITARGGPGTDRCLLHNSTYTHRDVIYHTIQPYQTIRGARAGDTLAVRNQVHSNNTGQAERAGGVQQITGGETVMQYLLIMEEGCQSCTTVHT